MGRFSEGSNLLKATFSILRKDKQLVFLSADLRRRVHSHCVRHAPCRYKRNIEPLYVLGGAFLLLSHQLRCSDLRFNFCSKKWTTRIN